MKNTVALILLIILGTAASAAWAKRPEGSAALTLSCGERSAERLKIQMAKARHGDSFYLEMKRSEIHELLLPEELDRELEDIALQGEFSTGSCVRGEEESDVLVHCKLRQSYAWVFSRLNLTWGEMVMDDLHQTVNIKRQAQLVDIDLRVVNEEGDARLLAIVKFVTPERERKTIEISRKVGTWQKGFKPCRFE